MARSSLHPFNANGVGIFDPADDSFRLVDISMQFAGHTKFAGTVTAPNGRIIFAPMFAGVVGIFNPAIQEDAVDQEKEKEDNGNEVDAKKARTK